MVAYTKDAVAQAIIAEGRRRGISARGITIGIATGLVESNLTVYANNKVPDSLNYPHDAVGSDGFSVGAFQQQVVMGNGWWWGDAKTCMDPTTSAGLFFDRLARLDYNGPNSPGSYAQAVQKSSFPDRYDQRMGEATAIYARLSSSSNVVVPAAVAPQTYGMPTGSNSGGYGGNSVKFPDWVYQLGNAFNVKPSTYPGHQETDRNEAGYAPNPQHLNRGIDWAGSVADMQRLADYLFSIKGELEQVIWWNPQTNRRIGVAGGKDVTTTPYYDYPGGYDDHQDHVHTRQSHPIPLPGGVSTVTTPAVPVPRRPDFVELDFYSGKKVGQGFSVRSRTPINFFIHTEEGNGTAESLARFCDGSNGVSYHYTLRDRKVCDVVDTDYYSWSVLSANVFSINLCFAGSKAAWTRAEWLQREGDIEIAAYLAVQDCQKYGIPTTVIAPPYHEAAGISDHKYVTQQLGIGNHTDVGNNFPWDVFARYVTKYATTQPTTQGDDDLTPEQDQMLRAIFKEQTQRHPSRSAVREPNEGLVDTWAGMSLNTDGNVDLLATYLRATLKFPPAVERLKRVAAGGEPGRNADDALLAQAMLAELYKAKPATTAVAAAPAAVPAVVTAAPDTSRLEAEVGRLSDQFEQLRIAVNNQPAPYVPQVSSEVAVHGDSTGDKIQRAVDSNMDYTDHVLAMDAAKRTALTRALNSIDPSNGDQA